MVSLAHPRRRPACAAPSNRVLGIRATRVGLLLERRRFVVRRTASWAATSSGSIPSAPSGSRPTGRAVGVLGELDRVSGDFAEYVGRAGLLAGLIGIQARSDTGTGCWPSRLRAGRIRRPGGDQRQPHRQRHAEWPRRLGEEGAPSRPAACPTPTAASARRSSLQTADLAVEDSERRRSPGQGRRQARPGLRRPAEGGEYQCS